MKIHCSNLRCPHCGSSAFQLFEGEVFLCEYCNEKFSYNIDEIDFTKERVLVEELKSQFYDKVSSLYEEKKKNYYMLLEYKKLAYPKILNCISIIGLIISIFSLLTGLIILYSITAICGFILLLIFSTKRNKKRYNLYEPYVSFYAKEIVYIQSEIDLYTKLISRLTK